MLKPGFLQPLVHLQNLDFVAQFGPPAMHFGIFMSVAQGFLRPPIAQQHVLLIACVAEKEIATVAGGFENRLEFAQRGESFLLFARQELEDGEGENFLRHLPKPNLAHPAIERFAPHHRLNHEPGVFRRLESRSPQD